MGPPEIWASLARVQKSFFRVLKLPQGVQIKTCAGEEYRIIKALIKVMLRKLPRLATVTTGDQVGTVSSDLGNI